MGWISLIVKTAKVGLKLYEELKSVEEGQELVSLKRVQAGPLEFSGSKEKGQQVWTVQNMSSAPTVLNYSKDTSNSRQTFTTVLEGYEMYKPEADLNAYENLSIAAPTGDTVNAQRNGTFSTLIYSVREDFPYDIANDVTIAFHNVSGSSDNAHFQIDSSAGSVEVKPTSIQISFVDALNNNVSVEGYDPDGLTADDSGSIRVDVPEGVICPSVIRDVQVKFTGMTPEALRGLAHG